MAIARPTTKTKISTTEWGWPVTDAVNLNTTDIAALKSATAVGAWVDFSFQNGWINDPGTQSCQYRKIGDIVYLRGRCKGGAISSVITTFPVGFRPPANIDMTTVVYNNTTWIGAQTFIQATGNLLAPTVPAPLVLLNIAGQFSVI